MAIEKIEPRDLMTRRRGDIQAYYHEDEVSLVDLILVLLKHKVLIAVILILSVLGGYGIALTKPKIYTFSTSIESFHRNYVQQISPINVISCQ